MKHLSTILIYLFVLGLTSAQGQALNLNKGEEGIMFGGNVHIANQFHDSGVIRGLAYGGNITSGSLDLGITHSVLLSDEIASGSQVVPFLMLAENSQERILNLHFGLAYSHSKVRFIKRLPQSINSFAILVGLHKTHSTNLYRMTPYFNISRVLADGGQDFITDTNFNVGLDVYQHKADNASGFVYGPQIGYSKEGVFTAGFSIGYFYTGNR
ncbi:MAG: hypothetical protein WD267_02175 [Balneolales bacterium]